MSNVISKAIPGEKIQITTNESTEPFWQAAKEERLTACKCKNCGHFRMPPSPFCPECQSMEVEFPTLPGTGTIFSFAICNQSPYPDVPQFTYIPIVVDLDGTQGAGSRLIANLIGADPEKVQIGQKVKVVFTPIQDGWKLPNFELV